ncbi:hypothetical protein HN51_004607, partial [Arachis hypogaea]
MELGSILHFVKDKTILITGAIDFLAKNNQPNVKKLFQPNSTKSATHRLQNE